MKADSTSLEELKRTLNSDLNELVGYFEDFKKLTATISQHWNDEKFGSFKDAMYRIYKSEEDVKKGCKDVENLINEFVDTINHYHSINF